MNYHNIHHIRIDRKDLTFRLQDCLRIKAKYPDSIMLFQYQDPLQPDDGNEDIIYEAYGFDAEEIAIPLDIVITHKLATDSGNTEEFMHAVRFPDYALKRMLLKLLKREQKVVIVNWQPRANFKNLKPLLQFPRMNVVLHSVDIATA